MKNIYTDLALEERERFQKNVEIEGVEINKKYDRNLKMTTTVVDIVSEKGAETMGKPIGSYITIETKKLQKQRESERKKIAKQLSENLSEITKGDSIKNVLIVGLGNSLATPDALGPKTIEEIISGEGVYCIAPGVLAQTGMETYSVIKGIVNEINPDLIIAIDSLAARSVRRITTTIQVTDTGITPGSGIGNHRKGLNKENLGRKVIAIGVPMVVSGATIVNDTMEKLIGILSTLKNNTIANIFKDYTQEEKYQLFEELLSEETEQMFVTPKDVDEIVENLSKTIAHSLNEFCRQALF
ncbi:GPR endopeptidase [Eubacterium sp.]|uniref:GPR endopeptidase n=1 Tax=Eubacterium sp. TaxID=142586 RepID=UPI00399162AA